MNKQQKIDTAYIKLRLFTIRNIANIAGYCPEKYAEAYVLQDVVEHIAEMVQSLIEEIDSGGD